MKRFIAILTLPAMLLFAQMPGMGMQGKRPMMGQPPVMERPIIGSEIEDMLEALGLKGKTAEKAMDLWYAHQKDMLDLNYQLRKAKLELAEYINTGKFSLNKVIEKLKSLQTIKNKIEENRLNFKVEIFKLLPKDKQKDFGWWLIGDRMGMMRRHMMKTMGEKRMMRMKNR